MTMPRAGLPNAPPAVNAWFGSLSAARQAQLLSRSAPLRLWQGEMVLRQHAEAPAFFRLVSGLLKAFTLRADEQGAILTIIGPRH